MDPILLVEIGIVALIILVQIFVFSRNISSTRKLGQLFPSGNLLEIQEETVMEPTASQATVIPQLKDNPRFSTGFREILQRTNDYLRRNKGASEGERLQEIASRKSDSFESAIETNLPLPLYIGLLATFTGVIIGLIQIAIEGVSDAAIQSFLAGVVVGMVGSASGLALTVAANSVFKNKKEQRDEGMENYFQFLRTRVFHPEAAPVSGSVKGLRDSLAAFQGGFVQYQGNMNDSLGETLRMFSELKEVFKQVRSIEQELSGIDRTIRNNDELLEKQMRSFETYAQKSEVLTRKLGTSFDTIDQQVQTTVDQNLKALENSTQTAYLKMDQYLASIEGTDRAALAKTMGEELGSLKGEVNELQEKSLQINAQLLERLNREEQSHQVLASTVQQLNQRIQNLSGEGGFANSTAMRIFAYTGIGAFLLGIAGGATYLVQTFAM